MFLRAFSLIWPIVKRQSYLLYPPHEITAAIIPGKLSDFTKTEIGLTALQIFRY